ncbi:hypothetical protein J3Q64DRAFT_1849511 [Phycomyces blakesleeanus]|uniref:Uncharacterized protein n=1 Tax=Phycomyces blakesleeanus TaxID=4837 RepID=A0ABR3AYC3_PHYBL
MQNTPGADHPEEPDLPEVTEEDIKTFGCWETSNLKNGVLFCLCEETYKNNLGYPLANALANAVQEKFPDDALGALVRHKIWRGDRDEKRYIIEFAFDSDIPRSILKNEGIQAKNKIRFPLFTHPFVHRFRRFRITQLPIIRKDTLKTHIKRFMGPFGNVIFVKFEDGPIGELFGGNAWIMLYIHTLDKKEPNIIPNYIVYSDDEGKEVYVNITELFA